MFYLISQVMLILAAAALTGIGLGWAFRGIQTAREVANLGEAWSQTDRTNAADIESLRRAERNNSDKDQRIQDLERQLADNEENRRDLEKELAETAADSTDQENRNSYFREKIREYRDTDERLRERIRRLEKMLSDAHLKAGQDLLLRIVELENMLETERHKAEVLPDSPEVSDIKFRVQTGKVLVKPTTSHLSVFFALRPKAVFDRAPDRIDDLQRIDGIDASIEEKLNQIGFYQWDQLAVLSAEEEFWVDHQLKDYKGRIANDRWVEQAKELVKQENSRQGAA